MQRDEEADAAHPDAELVARLRAGDEVAFMELVKRYHGSLARLARSFVPSEAVAEEVAQEAWIAVVRGLDRFEGRSSLRTWIFRILVNTARARGASERRSLPFSSLAADGSELSETVDPGRFRQAGDPFVGYWATPPQQWWTAPEPQALAAETRRVVAAELGRLPAVQAQVVTLRDIEGWSAGEVCATLGLSEGNQRVLLHRGRARLRAALETHFAEAVGA